jgi:hypothetical protein
MKFGVGLRRKLTGAELSVRVMQAASLLPCLYVLSASGYRGIFAQPGVFSSLFDLGVSLLPRWEALGLSTLYRLTSSELAFYFVMLALALIWGLVSRPLLGERHGVAGRKLYAALIAADLLVRLIPLPFNLTFGRPMAAVGFAVRLVCLVLVVLDLLAHRRAQKE